LKRSEYDFEIRHRPGSKHINADVVSRHVAAAVQKDQVPEGSVEGAGETEGRVSGSKELIGRSEAMTNFVNKLYVL